jgi:hypothetical protein
MSYTLTTTDGTFISTIVDGTKDNTTSLTLPGPNFVGYGSYLNENLVSLMENFAGNTAPSGQNLQGQLWFDKFTQTLNVFTQQGYIPVSGIILSGSQPNSANEGNMWFSTSTNQLHLYDGVNWNLIGPLYTKLQGICGAVPMQVNDANVSGIIHNILAIQFGSTIIATFSSDPTFSPSPSITGFPVVNPGLTTSTSAGPMVLQSYTRAQLIAISGTPGAVAYDTTANQPVFFNGTNWCYFVSNAPI